MELTHWHTTAAVDGTHDRPPACCTNTFTRHLDAAVTDARDEAQRAEAERIITTATDQIDTYRRGITLVPEGPARDLVTAAIDQCADIIRQAACICPWIVTEYLGGGGRRDRGLDYRCAAHGTSGTSGTSA